MNVNRKVVLTALLVMVLSLSLATPAGAITGTFVPDNNHTYVGLVAFYDKDGQFVWRCSGSLLTPTVLLTAGHCADTVGGAASARVWFQQDAGVHFDPATQHDPVTGYPDSCAPGTLGTLCATSHKLYNFGYTGHLTVPNTHDAGLVILDQPITDVGYGKLAAAGSLDRLATQRGLQNETFTVSGYGLSYKNQTQTGKPNLSFRERLEALSKIVNVNSALTAGFNLQTQGNGSGMGGTCNGDSGGPVFYGGYSSNTIVGITSFGLNTLCRGTDFAFRTDQQSVLDWIAATVGAAEFAKIQIVPL